MITANEFLMKWKQDESPLVRYNKDQLKSIDLSNSSVEFLVNAGLPDSAPPFLNFLNSNDVEVKQLSLDGNILNVLYIGYTGSGDLICIRENDGSVIICDFENNTRHIFLNSSIPQLAEFILIYAEFINRLLLTNGELAYLDKNASPVEIDHLYSLLRSIDKSALHDGAFWAEEINQYNNV